MLQWDNAGGLISNNAVKHLIISNKIPNNENGLPILCFGH